MFRTIRSRLTYANVTATLALFVALGGTGAYAANTVFSTDIVDGEVKAADIGSGEVGSIDVKDNSINTFDVHSFLGVDVVDGTLTGDDIGDGAIGERELADGAVNSAKTADDSLTGADVDEPTLNLAAEAWHRVGTSGEPAFNSDCIWETFDGNHNPASFLRDRAGIVHLRGLVESRTEIVPGGCTLNSEDARIFTLPPGYRPELREVYATLSGGGALARVNVQGPAFASIAAGGVSIETPSTFANTDQWLSLDGLSFRCAPSGQDGCP